MGQLFRYSITMQEPILMIKHETFIRRAIMFELLALLVIGLLGGLSDDTGPSYSGSSSRNKSSSRSRSKYNVYDHDIDCDGYCYECDDFHDF